MSWRVIGKDGVIPLCRQSDTEIQASAARGRDPAPNVPVHHGDCPRTATIQIQGD